MYKTFTLPLILLLLLHLSFLSALIHLILYHLQGPPPSFPPCSPSSEGGRRGRECSSGKEGGDGRFLFAFEPKDPAEQPAAVPKPQEPAAVPKAQQPKASSYLSQDEVLRQIFPDGIPAEVVQAVSIHQRQATATAAQASTLSLQREVGRIQSEIDQFPVEIRESLEGHIRAAEDFDRQRELNLSQDRQPDGQWEFQGGVAVPTLPVDDVGQQAQPAAGALVGASAHEQQIQPGQASGSQGSRVELALQLRSAAADAIQEAEALEQRSVPNMSQPVLQAVEPIMVEDSPPPLQLEGASAMPIATPAVKARPPVAWKAPPAAAGAPPPVKARPAGAAAPAQASSIPVKASPLSQVRLGDVLEQFQQSELMRISIAGEGQLASIEEQMILRELRQQRAAQVQPEGEDWALSILTYPICDRSPAFRNLGGGVEGTE